MWRTKIESKIDPALTGDGGLDSTEGKVFYECAGAWEVALRAIERAVPDRAHAIWILSVLVVLNARGTTGRPSKTSRTISGDRERHRVIGYYIGS